MTPRPRFPRLATRTAPQPENGNGRTPKLRMRPQSASRVAPSRGGSRRVSPLALVGVALIILALIIDLGVLSASSNRTTVLVATRALPAGTVLSASDLRSGQIAGEASLLGS